MVAPGGVQVHGPHSPRLPNRHRSAGKWHRPQLAQAFEARRAGGEHLEAPQSAVGPITGSVQGHPDHCVVPAVVGQAGSDVGMMMLYADPLHPLQALGPLGGEILGMEVVGGDLRRDPVDPPEVLEALLKRS